MAEFAEYTRCVMAGFSGKDDPEAKRLDLARRAYDFYRGDFERYSPRPRTGIYQSARYQRTSLIMRRIVEALTKHLYARGPARSLPDDEAASRWLNAQYTREGVDGRLQEADRLACVGDVCAVQVCATDDPDRPIEFHLWPAHQFICWESEADGCAIECVATIDFYDQRRRLKLWTVDSYREFRTNKGDGTTGGTAFYPVGPEEVNELGALPFAFVHFNPPNTEFWSGGPGDHLAEANDYINYFLTEMGDSVRYCMKPIVKAFGVREGWTPPGPTTPGDLWTIPPAYTDASGNGVPPDLTYLQADPSFIEGCWSDAMAYLDHTMECNNCPPVEVRMSQSGARSGASIVMEQMPLVIRAIGRQRDFARYETDLARVALLVGGLDPGPAQTLTLRWPSMIPDIPGASTEQDAADLEQLTTGQTSRVMVAMRKFNFTRAEAVAHLKQIADDLAEEATLGLPPVVPVPAPAADPEANPPTEPPPPPPIEKDNTDG